MRNLLGTLLLAAVLLALGASEAKAQTTITAPGLIPLYETALFDWGVEAPAAECQDVTVNARPRTELEALGRSGREWVGARVLCEISIWSEWQTAGCGLAQAVMDHEVGHALDYEHVADPHSIMFPTIPVETSEWFCLRSLFERREVAIAKQAQRCERVAARKRRWCWDIPRTWRRDLKRERAEAPTAPSFP